MKATSESKVSHGVRLDILKKAASLDLKSAVRVQRLASSRDTGIIPRSAAGKMGQNTPLTTQSSSSPMARINLQTAGLHLLFFLRFIQLGSVTIAGFIYCYLVWHHNNHLCVYYPRQCTPWEMSNIEVPWEYKVVISAVGSIISVGFAETEFVY
jgi:hypothetical protein